MTQTTLKQLTAIAFAVFMVTSMAGLGLAAVTVDSTNDANTDPQVLTDGETISQFDGNESDKYRVQVTGENSTNYNLDVALNDSTTSADGTIYHSNESVVNVSGPTASGTTYNVTFNGQDINDVPREINESVTVDVIVYNSSNASKNVTIQVTLETTDDYSVRAVQDNQSFVDITSEEPPLYRPFRDDYNATTVDDRVSITENTTVIYSLDTTEVQDTFEHTTEDNTDTGSVTYVQADLSSGTEQAVVPVFYKSVPDWYDSSVMGSYAVYDPSAGTLTITPEGDVVDDESAVSVFATSNPYRIQDTFTVMSMIGLRENPQSSVSAVLGMVM